MLPECDALKAKVGNFPSDKGRPLAMPFAGLVPPSDVLPLGMVFFNPPNIQGPALVDYVQAVDWAFLLLLAVQVVSEAGSWAADAKALPHRQWIEVQSSLPLCCRLDPLKVLHRLLLQALFLVCLTFPLLASGQIWQVAQQP